MAKSDVMQRHAYNNASKADKTQLNVTGIVY